MSVIKVTNITPVIDMYATIELISVMSHASTGTTKSLVFHISKQLHIEEVYCVKICKSIDRYTPQLDFQANSYP